MKKYYVYIVECSDSSYYTGVTNNIERRIAEHNEGIDPKSYTYQRRPVKLLWFTDTNDVNYAILREKQIKGWTRKKKEALIESRFDDLIKLSKSHSSTGSE
jgi:putative endonuclease